MFLLCRFGNFKIAPVKVLLLLIVMACPIQLLYAQRELPYKNSTVFKDSISLFVAITEAVNISKQYPDSSLQLFNYLYEQSNRLGYPYGMGMVALNQGIVLTNIHKLPEAKLRFDMAIAHWQSNSKGQAELYKVYSNLGNIAFLNGDYEEALALQLKALKIGERYPKQNIDHLYSNVAMVLMQLGRSTESVTGYLRKAEAAALQFHNYDVLSKVYNNMGLSLSLEQKWDSSLTYFNKALVVAKEHKLPTMVHLAMSNLGIIYLEQNNLDSALPYLQQAYAMDSIATSYARSRTRGALGIVYVQLGRWKEAKPLLLAQYNNALANNNKHDLRDAYYNLSKLYGAEGNYKEGYMYAWNYILTNDSIAGKEIINNVNDLEIKYRTAEQEKQMLAHKLRLAEQEENGQRKSKWLWAAVATVLLLMTIIITLRLSQSAKRKLLSQQIKVLEQHREIDKLNAHIHGEEQERSRIAKDLHDGLGALVSAAKINVAVLGKQEHDDHKEVQERTMDILEDIGKELRMTAHNMMPTAIADHNLKDALYNFCAYASKGKNLKIEFQAYGDLKGLSDDYQLAVYRIIQELINNIVKHAQAARALVQLVYQDAILSLTVEDNGKGFSYHEGLYEGMGMQSIKDRVKSKNGTFSLSSTIDKGTSVYIEFEIPE